MSQKEFPRETPDEPPTNPQRTGSDPFSAKNQCYNFLVPEKDEKPGDVAKQSLGHAGEFRVRFIEGPRSFLNWQAGILKSEHRFIRASGAGDPFDGRVTLFYLLGYGTTQDEAVEMAARKLNGRGR